MSRTPLALRRLPNYTAAQEAANTVTHIIGGAIGILVLICGVLLCAFRRDRWDLVGMCIYGSSMIALYTVSSVYHGLKPGMAKKVMQVLDHCTIYFLIAGTYTPILIGGLRPTHPVLCWVLFGIQWGLTAFGVTFTAIDHNRFQKLSMVCYLCMGWTLVLALPAVLQSLGKEFFAWILAGGVLYTLGAVLYMIGAKKPVFHTVFHIFTVIGSLLQAIGILFYMGTF